MFRNWLDAARKTVTATGLVALLNGCNTTVIQDGDTEKAQQTTNFSNDGSTKKYVIGIKIFGKRYGSTISDHTQLLEDLQKKLNKTIFIDKKLRRHLSNEDIDNFLREYKRSQKIVDTLVHVHSLIFTKYFESSLQLEVRKKVSSKDYAKDVYPTFLNNRNFLLLKNAVQEYIETRGPFSTLFANLTQNPTKPEEYANLESYCSDTDALTFAVKLLSFGRNYTKEHRRDNSPVRSWELLVIFDDERLDEIKRGEEQLHAGEFAKVKYDEPSDMFSFSYTNRTKPIGFGNSTFTEREFQVIDLGVHGTLSSADARFNNIHPNNLALVNERYRDLLQRTLSII